MTSQLVHLISHGLSINLKNACDPQVVEYGDEDVSSDWNCEKVAENNEHVLRSKHVDLSRCPQKSDGGHEACKERQRYRK